MTTTLTPPTEEFAEPTVLVSPDEQDLLLVTQEDEVEEPVAPVSLRPVIAAALSSTAASLVVGGIFGSWSARIFGTLCALVGAALAAWVLRSKRPALAQFIVPIVVLGAAALSVLPAHSPGEVLDLVRDAIDAGRLLRPPVPFDPGWRPLFVVVLGLLGFGAAWVGAALDRPLMGVVLPIPLVGLAAITQPDSEQVLAGVFAFIPILAALGVLFGADTNGETLDRSFELTRLVRSAVPMVALGVALVLLGNTGFLFPEPVIDPNDRPQKPKSIPLSASQDRVLFTVKAPAGFSGPWRTGVLDIYEDDAWKLPGATASKLTDLSDDGILDRSAVASEAERTPIEVTLTTKDLGPTAVIPVVPTARRVRFAGNPPDFKFDARTGGLRVPSGRAPADLAYTLTLPGYPTATQLGLVSKVTARATETDVPAAPPAIQRLLAQAPPGPWARLDFLRKRLLDKVTASGGGSPQDISPKRVVDLLQGSKKGSPFEIVAAQALLARWAGVPSRIGYGFNGVNEEAGQLTVRPKNAAQWLEVKFDGYGWIPLLDVPPQAQADLENEDEPDQILPSDEIAVQVFVPIERVNPRLLFERVRDYTKQALPFVGVVLAAWLMTPVTFRTLRRRKREKWADELGPRARIAVAYTEFRDAAADLALGDPFATPIEFLDRVVPDGEHSELAWLTSRTLYGDLGAHVTDDDARAAEELSLSLRTRLRQAQPVQTRAIGFLSKSSLLKPYTEEVPTMRVPTPLASSRRMVVAFPRRALGLTRRVLRRPNAATQRPATLLMVVLALFTSGCSGSDAEKTEIGVNKVALSLAFKDQSVVKPIPPKVIVTLVPFTNADIAKLTPGVRLPREFTSPFACTPAPKDERPTEVASVAITKPPKPGTYLMSNKGALEVASATVTLKLNYPPISKMIIRNIKKETIDVIYYGKVNVTSFEVENQITPLLSIIDKYAYDTDSLDLVERTFVNDKVRSTFTPQPTVNVFGFGGQGSTYQGAGVDVSTLSAMVVNGTVPAKVAVDACGKVLDTYQADTTEQVLNVNEVSTSGTNTNQPTKTYYATQLGGLVVKREAHTTQTIASGGGTATVKIDVVSTLINTEPLG
ncbi:MAG: transglutaminase domain-containing protein [Acidimicrobiales bacterium]|nr:transglutaminase domain-containing protein [Acidimicrobiales bacterium]